MRNGADASRLGEGRSAGGTLGLRRASRLSMLDASRVSLQREGVRRSAVVTPSAPSPSPSRAAAPTSRDSGRAPGGRATASSSTARRCSSPTGSTPTCTSSPRAPARRRRASPRAASPCSWWRRGPRGSGWAASSNLTGELANRVAYDAVQIFGGYGYMREFPVERFYRDARLWTIGGGTSEIMKEIIAKRLGL